MKSQEIRQSVYQIADQIREMESALKSNREKAEDLCCFIREFSFMKEQFENEIISKKNRIEMNMSVLRKGGTTKSYMIYMDVLLKGEKGNQTLRNLDNNLARAQNEKSRLENKIYSLEMSMSKLNYKNNDLQWQLRQVLEEEGCLN